MNNKTFCNLIPIIGRSNVGKSTLMNHLLGKKISITSKKLHTTIYPMIGINTEGSYQMIYLDTPGIIYDNHEDTINNYFMYLMQEHIYKYDKFNIESVIFVVENLRWTIYEQKIVHWLRDIQCSIILVINKIDLLIDKEVLLPHIQFMLNLQHITFSHIIPISAKTGYNMDRINNILRQNLPTRKHWFLKDHITTHSKQFMASEIIREKMMRFLGEELPYTSTVKIEYFSNNHKNLYAIYSVILVNRLSQKKIVVGTNGKKIKQISLESRKSMEILFKKRIYLKIWVKLKHNDDTQSNKNVDFIDSIYQ